jgi:ubiquinone/menaquinone biosynthesis C-methylase UbiE
MAILEHLDVGNCADRQQIILHRARYDFVLAHLPPTQSVLEIGTGTGAFTRELSPKCSSYVGLEYDSSACQLSRQNTNHQLEIIQGDARRLPFGENQFSFIVCLEVLEHLGDFLAGVREIHRCINPIGTAIISVPYRKIGKKNVTEFHPYEPGERELVRSFQSRFKNVGIYYQYFEETRWMTLARKLRLRRLFGFDKIYADLAAGLPHATEKFRLGKKSGGMNVGLVLVVSGKK